MIHAFGDSFVVGDQDDYINDKNTDPESAPTHNMSEATRTEYLKYNVSFAALIAKQLDTKLKNHAVRGTGNFPQLDLLFDQLNNKGVLLPVGHANIIVNFLLPSKNNIGKAEVITSSRHICEVDNLLHFGYEVDNVLHLEGEQHDEDKMTFDGIRNNYATIYNQQGVLDKDIEQEIVEDFLKLTFDRGTREHDFIKSPDHRGGQIVVTSSGALNTIDVLVKSTIPPKDDDDILTLGDVSKENLAQLLRQGFHETDVYIYMRKSALPRILKEGVTSDAFDKGKKDWSWRNSVDESGRRTRYFSATKRKNEEVAVSSFFDLVTADRIFKRFEYYATRSS